MDLHRAQVDDVGVGVGGRSGPAHALGRHDDVDLAEVEVIDADPRRIKRLRVRVPGLAG